MKYWYLFTTFYCPICGHEWTYKERQYTAKPETWEQRHVMHEHWDFCDAL